MQGAEVRQGIGEGWRQGPDQGGFGVNQGKESEFSVQGNWRHGGGKKRLVGGTFGDRTDEWVQLGR